MGKPEFGRKVTCAACAVRFYDLSRSPVVCPKCGVEQPRVKPRAAPLARAATSVRWGGRQPPMVIEPAATVVAEADPLEVADQDDEDDEGEAVLPDDEDDAEDEVPALKHED